ncbi:MAG: hypothetical protein HFE36_03100 [Clostridia bacterium]|nr:hypothetical protein [Clostridia bacterium]
MKNYVISSDIREKVYNYIFIISIILSSGIAVLFNWLVKDIVATNIFVVYLNVFVLPTMGGINYLIKWLFNRYLWKIKFFQKVLGVPNLVGKYVIEGKNNNGIEYSGTLHINQTFSKISVKGIFANSQSNNIETYLSFDNDEIVLHYHYINEPKQKTGTMGIHYGFAEIILTKDLQDGNGKYFNDEFRETSGHWQISKMQ